MDDSTSHEAGAEEFQIARRGYDRRQVDSYREANEARIDALERHIRNLEKNMSELGLARPIDLAAELDAVGEEVKRVLQEARAAAEQMRSRAADDAARWRMEADEESRASRESARVVAFETRRSVWETGSEMLTSVVAAREMITVAATERALFIQAEAEREASRLVGDTKRERDESVGGAREEAERLVAAARQESDSLVSAARRQADAAQERARALELRRTELMAELETARATIAGSEVASAPDVAPEEPSGEPTGDLVPVEAVEEERTHWPDDEGSVKIVSAARVMTAEPVDADAMVAEVEAMRRVPSPQSPVAGPGPESEPSSVPSTEGRGDAEERSDEAGGQESYQPPAAGHELEAEPESGPEPEPEPEPERETHSEPEPSSVLWTEGRLVAVVRGAAAGGQESYQPPATRSETEAEPEPEPEPKPKPDPLSGLFAQLRESTADEEGGGVRESYQVPAAGSDSGPDPGLKPEAQPETEVEMEGGSESGFDPFALRDRYLLPVQNRTLRTVKRRLVASQNQALENFRLIEGWEPDATIVDGDVSEALTVLVRESMVAGFAAAAEMMGTDESPQPADAEPGDPSAEFAGALLEAARSAMARSRESGAGQRETASSLSRVFRSWRTDEAERRVQFASRSAYHVGVAAALADLGATDLAVTSSGRPCRECPANKGSWTIIDGLPDGTMMPPARLECACTVVPSF